MIEQRFHFVKRTLETEVLNSQLQYALEKGREEFLKKQPEFDQRLADQLKSLDDHFATVLKSDEPTVLPEKASEKLAEIAGWTFEDPSGPSEPLLSPEEVRFLSIPKGSLDADERLQIESHVIHSFRFLSQIPWTKELKRIPEIAKAHHEKLNGSGYPYRMKSDEIPFQAKMMTIADIFDALTARDRPYKRAVPVERALNIIGEEVKSELLDPNLFRLFVGAQVYQLTAKD